MVMVDPATGRRAATGKHRKACGRTRWEQEGTGGVEEDQGQDEVVAAEALHDHQAGGLDGGWQVGPARCLPVGDI